MNVGLQFALSDTGVDFAQLVSQRQLMVSISAIADTETSQTAPLNLCLVLDHSGSMAGRPLDTVIQAAERLVDRLSLGDRLSVVGFDHKAKVLVPNQPLENPAIIKRQMHQLKAGGGTAIDEGLRTGIEELAKGKQGTISQIFLLTDGENEHGDSDRCFKLAKLATDYNMTLNTLGFSDAWNQDLLEKLADMGGGSLSYIQQPEEAISAFAKLFSRIQTVGLTNAYLGITLMPGVRLAQLKPIAQVAPDAIELPVMQEGSDVIVRIGDLMVDDPRVVLANLYLEQQPVGRQEIAQLQIRYDNPATGAEGLTSDTFSVYADFLSPFQPNPDPAVQRYVLTLAKYRQTQLAEDKLKQGDIPAATTLLQSAAKTAIQMGDHNAATVLQENATRLQQGEELSQAQRKQTRIVSKTTLQ